MTVADLVKALASYDDSWQVMVTLPPDGVLVALTELHFVDTAMGASVVLFTAGH